ncbi:hypothetical protein Tco_0482325 [Tanacetum coccineum]
MCLWWQGIDIAYQIDNLDFKSNQNGPCTHARDDSLTSTMRFGLQKETLSSYGAIILSNDESSPARFCCLQDLFMATTSRTKKVVAPKPKPTKKKTLVKADRGKGLNVLSEVALFEAAQFKDVTKRSKKDFHISHASGSMKELVLYQGFPMYLNTIFKVEESWGDSGEEDEDDENDSENNSDDCDDDDDGNDGNDDDANDDDNQEGDDTNDDDEETNKEEEKIDDEEMMDDDEDDEVHLTRMSTPKKRIIVVTRFTIMKNYDYRHLEEIEVRREDQKLYKFREGDFL